VRYVVMSGTDVGTLTSSQPGELRYLMTLLARYV
jgi:hypothetical protein